MSAFVCELHSTIKNVQTVGRRIILGLQSKW